MPKVSAKSAAILAASAAVAVTGFLFASTPRADEPKRYNSSTKAASAGRLVHGG